MTQYRDVLLKEKAKQDRKQDLLKFQRAVLTDAQGNQTGSGSVWASQSERRVWCMTSGAIQPGQVLCVRVSDPVIGLGVIIGYADGSNEKEVLSDDFFLRKTGDPTGWYSTSPGDLEPGGLKMMWLYPKAIVPLATYPDPTGLSVNVIAGDYSYAGARVSFGGQSGYLLVEPATPGEHYYAGLYLDGSNTLQVVYGTAVVIATSPPEPTWPAGAFRLSVVKIANGQTSLNFNDDVFDRRMPWSDEQAGAASGGSSSEPDPFINGALQFWQRGTSFAAMASGTYMADRFFYAKVGAMVHTASQSTDVPTVAEAEALIPYSLLLDCTTVDSSIAASDFCTIAQFIEGNFASSILQREFTLSFWVKGTKTGVHCVSFRNSISDRSYIAEYTISTTATWEHKTITVSASPAAGTWNYTTGIGLSISWALACGSTYQTTAGTWQTGNFIATSSQVNACDSTSNDFRITGIKVEPGATATAFMLPDYEQEKARCKRYCQGVGFGGMAGTWLSATECLMYWLLAPDMRIGPTLTLLDTTPEMIKVSPTTGAIAAVTGSGSAITGSTTSPLAIGVTINGFTTGTAGQFASVGGAQVGADIILCSSDF